MAISLQVVPEVQNFLHAFVAGRPIKGLELNPASNGFNKNFLNLHKGPSLYYVWVKGWAGGIAKCLLFLTGHYGQIHYIRGYEKSNLKS